MNLKIKEIIKCTEGSLIIGNENSECTNYSIDTRKLQKGDTYIGIKGESLDGNLFWEDAFKNGAETLILNKMEIDEEKKEEYRKQNKNIIMVDDTILALGKMASYKRDLYGDRLKVIGVTGSVGKTSTKDIIANVMSQKYKTLKTQGNNNNSIGLPLTLLRLKDEEIAVIEMGMNHLGEISYLSKIAKPDIAVITNVGTAHIGILGSRENILKAKLEILDGMKNKRIVINNDNDLLNKWQQENNKNIEIHTFGINNVSEVRAEDIQLYANSSEFTCLYNNETIKINVPVGGEHFILNALCGVSFGKIFGLSNEEIEKGISTFRLTAKRMEIIKLKNNITLINDSYNASYESMKASIASLKNMEGTRKIAVLGDMFELGSFSEKLHRDVGVEVFKNKIDKLYVIGENVRFIVEEAINQGYDRQNALCYIDKEVLTNDLKEILKDGDVILIKASNGMKLFEVAEALM